MDPINIITKTKIPISPAQQKRQTPIDFLAKKILKGLALILLNAVTLGTINVVLFFPCLGSKLKNAYNQIFAKTVSHTTTPPPILENKKPQVTPPKHSLDLNKQLAYYVGNEPSTITGEIRKSSSQKKPSEYNLKEVINKVKEAREKGIKVAAFVGRRNDQPTPKMEGWLWFTIDPTIAENADSSHHMQVGVGSSQAIERLFDTVLVDTSVFRFIPRSWESLNKLLVLHEESTLITNYELNISRRLRMCVKTGQKKLPSRFNVIDSLYEVGEGLVVDREKIYKEVDETLPIYLQTLFTSFSKEQNRYICKHPLLPCDEDFKKNGF